MHTISTTRKFHELALTKYPTLRGNESHLRFFHYLCFSEFFDQQTHHLVLPTRTIAERFYGESYNGKFNGREVLEEFRRQVLPGLVWTEYSHGWGVAQKGKARTISNLGFDSEMIEALHREWLDGSQDRVNFVTGADYVREDRYRGARQATAEHKARVAQLSLNSTQATILDYLGALNAGHLFLRKLRENEAAIHQAISLLPQHVQDIRRRILNTIRHNPNVYYLPSGNGRTCRLSAGGDSIVGLKKEVRKAATKGWVECDLRSSQFAILAAKLEAPLAQAFIASGESIWREFHQFLFGVDMGPADTIKPILKETVYSLCFGKSERNLKEFLSQHGIPRLLEHPILQELLILRKKWFGRIEAEGGAHDVWGNWHAVTDDRWAGAIAGTVIQSVELEIIAPIFEVANKHGKSDQFKITLFQHDGGTISFNSAKKIPRAQAKLKKAVEDRARHIGVSTVLEFTQL